MVALAQGCSQLKSTGFYGGASGVTDVAVYALAQHCPKLGSVFLGQADKLTEPANLRTCGVVPVRALPPAEESRCTRSRAVCNDAQARIKRRSGRRAVSLSVAD